MKINIEEVRDFIESQSAETKIYIGADSERVKIAEPKRWMIDYMLVVVVHINGKNGCKVFGEVQREPDITWDTVGRPRMRLMNEVYKVSELYLALGDVLEHVKATDHVEGVAEGHLPRVHLHQLNIGRQQPRSVSKAIGRDLRAGKALPGALAPDDACDKASSAAHFEEASCLREVLSDKPG